MYLNAENVTVDDDEGRFTLVIDSTEEDTITVNIHGIDLDAFYDQVRARIGPYLREMHEARRTLPVADTRRLSTEEFSAYLDDAYGDDWSKRVGMEQMREQGYA